MKINAGIVCKLRTQKSWTQEELSIASGLNLKTIQRIEKDAIASLQSKKALASALDIDIQDLDNEEDPMKTCTECRSEEIYRYKGYISTNPECLPHLLPKLGSGILATANILPVVCGDCGHIRFFADTEAREKLLDSKHWQKL